MQNLTKEQIIQKFKNASIIIKESDCKGSHKCMIVTIHPDYGIAFFPSYHTAYIFYNDRNYL